MKVNGAEYIELIRKRDAARAAAAAPPPVEMPLGQAVTVLTGAQGERGLTGETGVAGAVGPQGDRGVDGLQGPVGPQGTPGVDGARGADGLQGPAGDRGPMGFRGLDGRAGTDGRNGADGKPGVVWIGPWSPSRVYVVGDAVEYNGSSYIATSPVSGSAPGSTPAWDLMARAGTDGFSFTGGGSSGLSQVTASAPLTGLGTPGSPLGLNATTANVPSSTNARYVTDAQLTVIGNTSGTNSGNVTLANSTNGLTIAGQVLTMAVAGAAATGSVTAAAQTFGGNKTFNGAVAVIGQTGGANQLLVRGSTSQTGDFLRIENSSSVLLMSIDSTASLQLPYGNAVIGGAATVTGAVNAAIGLTLPYTDTSAVPGAATINKPAGKCAIAVGATSIVITNSLVTTTTQVVFAFMGNPGASWWYTVAAGAITLNVSTMVLGTALPFTFHLNQVS